MILGHVQMLGEGTLTTESFIYAFHMPLFFFLSGMGAKQTTFKKTLGKCFRQLVAPYICWYIVNYIWWLVISFYRHPEMYERTLNEAVAKPLIGMVLALAFDTGVSTMAYVELWFIIALFWCKLLGSIISRRSAYSKLVCIALTITVSLILFYKNLYLPFSLGPACMAFPIYYLGVFIKCRTGDISSIKIRTWEKVVMIAASCCLLMLTTYFNGKVDVAKIVYGKNPVLTSVCG
mgnify:CR=1 FL=1